VIGFASEPKGCGFQFKIMSMSRGRYLTGTDYIRFNVFNSSEELMPTTRTYDEASGMFNLAFDNAEDGQDPNGYWVAYWSDGAGDLYQQYPARYKTSDYFNADDLIQPGKYEDINHCFLVTYTVNRQYLSGAVELGTPYVLQMEVESSVPYKVTGSYSVPYLSSVSAHGQLTLPAGSPAWMYSAFVGEGVYGVNAISVEGSDACALTGVGEAATIYNSTPQTYRSSVIGYYGAGQMEFEATITDASNFPGSVTAWRMKDYQYEYTTAAVAGFIRPTTCHVSISLNANYDY